jgi:hypothetical protein
MKLLFTFILFTLSCASFASSITCQVGYDYQGNGGFWVEYEKTVKAETFNSFKAILKKSKTGAPEDIYFGAQVTQNSLTSIYLMTENAMFQAEEFPFPSNNEIRINLVSSVNKNKTMYKAICKRK